MMQSKKLPSRRFSIRSRGWIKPSCDALSSCTAAYKAGLATGNMDEYKIVSYNVCRVVKEAKWLREESRDSFFKVTRSLWLGLRMITDYKTPAHVIAKTDTSLADDLNTFYARFEAT